MEEKNNLERLIWHRVAEEIKKIENDWDDRFVTIKRGKMAYVFRTQKPYIELSDESVFLRIPFECINEEQPQICLRFRINYTILRQQKVPYPLEEEFIKALKKYIEERYE